MSKIYKFVICFLILSIVIQFFSYQPIEAVPESKKWTFLINLDADNNLEEFGIKDVNELEVVGSTDEVNFVVQFDRIDGYDESNDDWTSTKRFYVTKIQIE